MRIGINVPLRDANERPVTAAQTAERARMIEAAGLDGIWIGGGGGRGFNRVDAMMHLLVAAGATTNVELGTSIYVASNVHPVEMAHDFVSIESLHPDRFTIGVGAGSGRGGEPYGYDFEGRFKRLHAHMKVVREICDGVALSELSDPEFVQPAPPAEPRRFGTPGSGVSLAVEVGGPRFVLGVWHSQISLQRSVRDYDGWMCSAGRTNFNTMEDAIKRYRDLGGARAMIGTCLVNLHAPTEKITGDDSYYLQCSPEEARDRVGRLVDLGFDDLLLVKADYPRKMGLYEADFTAEDLEEIRALLPRDERVDRPPGRGASSVTRELLNEIMDAVGEAHVGDGDVEFVGADPVYPTRFRIGDGGGATIAATGVAAARLWEMRTGRSQKVSVDVDAAALSMKAGRYLVSDPPSRERSGMNGDGPLIARDGRYMMFQTLFGHHVDRQVGVLGCSWDFEEIKRAVATWDAFELEEAIFAVGATGGAVRSAEEWAQTSHAEALERLPLLEVMKIGESDPEPLPPGDRPTAGIRMLDLTRVLAGPTCGRTIAEHGADVLRVGTSVFPDQDSMMRDTGHGKRSCELDLKSEDGLSTLHGLIPDADIFSQGYRPGAIANLGLSPEEVAAERPGIVYVTISAFGHEGPWRDRRGFDSVVQAVSGISHEGAGKDGRPRGFGANANDYATGYLAAFGAMTALRRRAEEGGSYHVRVSLAQTNRWFYNMGRADADAAAARPSDLSEERREQLMLSRDTPFGHLRHIGPVAKLSETPGYWDRPSVPLDHDRPEWI